MVGGQCHTLEMALEEVAIIVGQPLPAAARVEVVAQRRHAEAAPADGPAGRAPPRLAANSPPIEVLRQRADGAELEITGKDCANRRSLGWYHEDLLVHRGIAERHRAADPKAFALGGRDLVAHPLPDQFPFELSK